MSSADASLLRARRESALALAGRLAEESGIPVECILGRSHDPQVVDVRHRWWRMLKESGLSFAAVGLVVGRHHTTILAAVQKAPATRVRVA